MMRQGVAGAGEAVWAVHSTQSRAGSGRVAVRAPWWLPPVPSLLAATRLLFSQPLPHPVPESLPRRAGANGSAHYPLLLLSPDIKWHPDVRPGGTIHQEHDSHLLGSEFPAGAAD